MFVALFTAFPLSSTNFHFVSANAYLPSDGSVEEFVVDVDILFNKSTSDESTAVLSTTSVSFTTIVESWLTMVSFITSVSDVSLFLQLTIVKNVIPKIK